MGYDVRFHGDPHRPPAMEDTGEGQEPGEPGEPGDVEEGKEAGPGGLTC